MQVRFLRGTFIDFDNYALSDFEALSTGEVDNLNSGVTVNGDCRWDNTIIPNPR